MVRAPLVFLLREASQGHCIPNCNRREFLTSILFPGLGKSFCLGHPPILFWLSCISSLALPAGCLLWFKAESGKGVLWGEEGRCWELCFPHLRVVMSTRSVADPTLGPIEVMPELPLVHVTRVEASTGFSTVGNCQHGLQSLWEPVPLGMSSLKSSSRGRVWGFGKAGWVHLCPELRTQVCLVEGPLWGPRASEMRAAP